MSEGQIKGERLDCDTQIENDLPMKYIWNEKRQEHTEKTEHAKKQKGRPLGGAHVQRQWKEKQKRHRMQIQRKFNQPRNGNGGGVMNDVSSDGKFHKMGTPYPT